MIHLNFFFSLLLLWMIIEKGYLNSTNKNVKIVKPNAVIGVQISKSPLIYENF